MIIKDIESIKSLCELNLRNLPGIRSLSFTDARNMSTLGNIAPGAEVYNIKYRRWTGSLSDDHNDGAGGDYYTKTAQVYVPRYRYTCERIIQELVDRKVVVFVTDNNGDQHTIMFATFRSQFTTGARSGDSNGYTWTFTGRDRKKRFFASQTVRELTGSDYIPPPGDVGEIAPAPDPAIPVATSCCITVLATPIPESPLLTGNILNLNKVVTTITGEKWFIDKNGDAVQLSSGGLLKERIDGTGAAIYNLTSTYDPDRIIVNRTQNVLTRSVPITDIDQYDIIDGNVLHLNADWPLEPGEYIEIYKTA
jgi:hypothetical protein